MISSTAQKKKNEGAAMASQSPDLNMIKMLWWDLKTAVYKQMPANLNELNHIEKKPKFLESERLTKSAEGGFTSCGIMGCTFHSVAVF